MLELKALPQEEFLFAFSESDTPKTPKDKGLIRWEKTLQTFQEQLLSPNTKLGKYYQKWNTGENLNPYAHFEFSSAIIAVLHQTLPPEVAFVINSSTGKDSTLATHALIEAVREEIQSGRGWARPIAVAIADTGSEFPEMATRMRLEATALQKLGEIWKFPITTHVVRPEVKHRLLVELCGNGKPLPAISESGKTQGVSAWCMDRVKGGSLKKISDKMTELHGDYIAILGVRSAESNKRKGTMEKYGDGLPHGLSRITGKNGEFTLACTPIAHWDNRSVSDFIRSFPPPWRPEGREELRSIYFKGSPLEGDENFIPSECAVTISNEGQVSNSCSDLSGTRYGCWHCFLSTNKSLKNTARRDPRYVWPRKFHSYLYNKGKEALKRSKTLKKMGFTLEDSFSKTFTFLERYKMLMFLFRAEIESGLSLIQPEELQEIQNLWEKHGVFCVDPESAREDAKTWKKTGRWKSYFEDIVDEAHRLCNALSEGIPFGAIYGMKASLEDESPKEFSLEEPDQEKARQGLELTHLLAFAGQGFGTPPYPKLLAYVFEDIDPYGIEDTKIVTAITDTPSLLGLKTNTGLINGMSGTSWHALGVREPLPWEKEAAQDRNFVYRIHPQIGKQNTALQSCPTLEIMEWGYQLNLLKNGCVSDDPLKDEWFDLKMIEELPPIDKETFATLLTLTRELTATSDWLTDHFRQARQRILQEIKPHYPGLLEDSPQGKEAKSQTRKIVKRGLKLEEAAPHMRHYAKLMKYAARAIGQKILNTPLMLKLCYFHYMEAVDPPEAEKVLARILPHLTIR